MASRAELYGSQLDGYVRVRSSAGPKRTGQSSSLSSSTGASTSVASALSRSASASAALKQPRFLEFEGKDWWPIDIDEGDPDNPVDVDFWTYTREHTGDWTTNDVPSYARKEPKIFECGICCDTLFKPVVAEISRKPLKDDAFDLELGDAISEGVVEKPSGESTARAYNWPGLEFVEEYCCTLVLVGCLWKRSSSGNSKTSCRSEIVQTKREIAHLPTACDAPSPNLRRLNRNEFSSARVPVKPGDTPAHMLPKAKHRQMRSTPDFGIQLSAHAAEGPHGIDAGTETSVVGRRFSTRLRHQEERHRPFSRLSVEIITAILVLACGRGLGCRRPEDLWAIDKFSLATRSAVALVCTRWSTIVSECGLFWSSYMVRAGSPRDRFMRWTSRMKCGPYYLRVVLPKRPSQVGGETPLISVEDITEFLIDKAHSCHTLTIFSLDPVSFGVMANRLKCVAFPVMNRFTLVNGGRRAYNQGGGQLHLTRNTFPLVLGMVRDVRMLGYGLCWACDGQLARLSTLSIRHLDWIAAPTIDQLYAVLEAAVQLRRLCIEKVSAKGVVSGSAPLLMPSLVELQLDLGHNSDLAALISRVEAPLLSRFSARVLCEDEVETLWGFGSLLAPVQHLTLNGACSAVPAVAILYSKVLQLVELDISLGSRSFIQAIYRPLWKHLRRVSVQSPTYDDLLPLVSLSSTGRLHYLCVRYPGEVLMTASKLASVKLRVGEFEISAVVVQCPQVPGVPGGPF
ncbi:hypothetical protein K438DRAFT_1748308 [Mycena galopus ATCC 62051]|nr:hypothetical protein K438DRAFT_1748308 [Mycena galopus ATCC 62051]